MRSSPAGGTARPPLSIGIIGLGAISQTAHLPLLAKMRGLSVAALCDNDPGKARALAQRFEVPSTYSDIEDLLEAEHGLDALVITTPSHLHEPHALSALRAGLHVLVERPFALTSRGVDRIVAAARKVDRKVLVANNHRFRSDVQALSGFLHGSELGKVHSVRAGVYRLHGPDASWRLRRAEAGGGAFLELGLPMLDLAAWLGDFPEPVRVSAVMQRSRGANAVEDSMIALIEATNGYNMTIDVNWAYVGESDRWWFEVNGTHGTARLSPLRIVKSLNGVPTDVSPTGAATRDSAFIQSYRAELAHFIAVIRDEAEYEPPVDQVLVYRTMEAIYKAAEDGKEVRL